MNVCAAADGVEVITLVSIVWGFIGEVSLPGAAVLTTNLVALAATVLIFL